MYKIFRDLQPIGLWAQRGANQKVAGNQFGQSKSSNFLLSSWITHVPGVYSCFETTSGPTVASIIVGTYGSLSQACLEEYRKSSRYIFLPL